MHLFWILDIFSDNEIIFCSSECVNVNPMSTLGFQRTTQLCQFKPVCSTFLPLPGAQFVWVQMNKQEAPTNSQNTAGCDSDK